MYEILYELCCCLSHFVHIYINSPFSFVIVLAIIQLTLPYVIHPIYWIIVNISFSFEMMIVMA